MIVALFAFLSAQSKAEVVHSQTYQSSATSFGYYVWATHDDDFVDENTPPQPSYSKLFVSLTVTIRDLENNVVSSSALLVEMSGGQVTYLIDFADSFAYFDLYKSEDTNTGNSEFSVSFQFFAPATLENYTIEILLEKYPESDDPHTVTYDDYGI